MAETNVSTPPPRKRHGVLRVIGWILGILIVLVVVAYFIGTSSAFLKGVILPRVSKSMNAQITVSDASISPFSRVVLHDVKVQTTGSEPLVTVPEVRLRYSLMDIIGGHINVDEVTLSSPTIVLVQNPDGTSNLDPILKSQKQEEKPSKPSTPSKPLQINVKKVELTDATIRQIKLYKGGNRDLTELSHVNLGLDNLQNGQTAKLSLAAQMKMENNPPSPGTNGVLEAKANGAFNLALTSDLKPASIQGNTRLEVSRAEGSLAQAAALSANLDCDVTPTDIKQVALRFQKGGTPLGELRVAGPFNLEKSEGRIDIQLSKVDKNLLNVAGAASGIDFGPTTVDSTNTIQLSNGGKSIAAAGQFGLHQFQITRTNQTTPPLDLSASYDVSVDQTANKAVIRTFDLSGTQKGKQLLKGGLTSPMTIPLGNVAEGVGDSALNITLTHLDLADWKPFAGEFAPAGDVNMKLQLLSQQAGKALTFELSSEINNLTAGSGSNQITQANITLQVNGKASDFNQFTLRDYKFGVARQGQSLVTVSGSGTYDKSKQTADLQVQAQLLLAQLLQVLPRPDLKASSGTVDVTTHVTQKENQRNVTGKFNLTDLTAQFGSNNFQSFGMTADFDIGMTPDQVQIRKIAGNLTQAKNAGGAFEASGTYGLNNKAAQLTAKLTDFNQNGLRPFLEPMLTDKKLTSVALNANASVQYDPNAASSVKAELQVTNLVVNDPKGQFPSTPLEARCQLDAALNKQVADIRQCQLALTPTAKATNSINLTGHIDMTQTNATQGNIKIAADSLDLTSYYDLFGGQKKTTTTVPGQNAPQTTSVTGSPAPQAAEQTNSLPLRNFTAETSIGRLYLHEVDIANFQTSTKIDGGHVVVNPCKLALNNAPVDANVDLDMGVPGYKYDLAFNAQAVPLAPLVNTFQPERKGQIGGTFSATAKISGTGSTGEALQKTLTGQFDMSSTNLNLSVNNVKTKWIKEIVMVVVAIPDLLKGQNLLAAGTSLVQNLANQNKASSSNDLSKSPINAIVARGNAGSGKVTLQQVTIQSPAFRADVNGGTITLAPILTNSALNIPVSVALSQSIARPLNLVSADTPTNAPYAKLPDFFKEVGTIGEPKRDINAMALIKVAAQGLSGVIPHLGGQSGSKGQNLLQGLGGLLGGNPPANNNAPTNTHAPPATNPPPAQEKPLNNLLNNFLKPRK
ncbi:MAG TPA: AsmA family protein [Patescibacteria group bacterium]|nr:AsmA family protein [Patescibacteria group bacterium]